MFCCLMRARPLMLSIPESGMFFWRRGGEIALVKCEFFDVLEEFDGLPLREQRKRR